MSIVRIAVGIDFSPESERAAREALRIARHVGAEVALVHVGVVGDRTIDDARPERRSLWQQAIKERLLRDRAALERLRERLSGQGVPVTHAVYDGFAEVGLCDAAGQLGAQLLVTGTHGRTGVSRFLLGSVAERVVRLASTSVLVARSGEGAAGGGSYRRILVATDFTPLADRALALAIELAAPEATIDVVHCWQMPSLVIDTVSGPIAEELAAESQQEGEQLLARHADAPVTVRFHALPAAAPGGIVEHLEAGDYELCCIGSHGRRGVQRLLLGSVAERVVRHAPCSVLVAHAAR